MTHWLPLLPILGLTCFTTAGPPAPEPEPPSVNEAGAVGYKVVIDPITGEVIDNPSDRELEELSRLPEGAAVARRPSAWELREFSLPTGGRGVYLDSWAHHSLAIEVTADGGFRTVCSQGDVHAETVTRAEANDK